MHHKRAFGELELEILNAMKSGQKMSVKEVHQLLGVQNKYTTIMTVMSRLVEKKLLDKEKIGHQNFFWLVSNKIKETLFVRLKKMIYGSKTAEVVTYLIDSAEDISDIEYDQIMSLLQEAKKQKIKSKNK
jgi:predicted transcriptional regulator